MAEQTRRNKLGFSFLYFTPRVTEEHFRWLGALREHGYDGAELPVVEASSQDLIKLSRATEDEDLQATAVGFAVPEANPISSDPRTREKSIEHLSVLAEKAAILGAKVLAGPVHSAYGLFSGSPPTQDEWKWCSEVLHAVGERAHSVGVKIAIEPLNRFECYFLNTAATCSALVRAVDHPAVVGALDTHHAHIEEDDLVGALRSMGATLGHVQLSENHRGTLGRGQVDFVKVLHALDEMEYGGWLVIEAFSRIDPGLGSDLRIWRRLDEGPEDVLSSGPAVLTRAALGES